MNLFTFKLLVILYLIMVVSYYIIGVINIAKSRDDNDNFALGELVSPCIPDPQVVKCAPLTCPARACHFALSKSLCHNQ